MFWFHTLEKSWSISDVEGETPPDPVSVDEAKVYCRFDSASIDDDFARWISAARDLIETDTNRRLIPKVGVLKLERFPSDFLLLEQVPATAIESITYLNGSGNRVEWDAADYVSDLSREPGLIVPAYGLSWPSARRTPGSVEITVSLGYAEPADVPPLARQLILFLVGQWFSAPDLAGAVPAAVMESYQTIVRRLSWGAYP